MGVSVCVRTRSPPFLGLITANPIEPIFARIFYSALSV
jgi:hypothetical protein